jgi:AAA ATPase domain
VAQANDANPFSPGAPPAVVIGRQRLLQEIERAFGDQRHRARKTVLRAHRGSGKTVLLDEIQDLATAAGWLVVQEDAGSRSVPLMTRLIDQLQRPLDSDPPPRREVKGVTGSVLGVGGGVTWGEPEDQATPTLRSVLDDVLRRSTVRGVLLSIDEIHEATRDEIQELGNAVQHLERDGRAIAVALAGLPSNDETTEPTFLSRWFLPQVGVIEDSEIRRGFIETAALSGWSFTPSALAAAINVAAGFPYMMQLIGFEAFEQARSSSPGTIDVRDVEIAIPKAERELNRSVLHTLERRVTPVEQAFLFAMAEDPVESRVGDISKRMNQSAQYVDTYKNRLLESGLIRQVGRGLIDFAIPGHRSQIRADEAYGAMIAARQRSEASD